MKDIFFGKYNYRFALILVIVLFHYPNSTVKSDQKISLYCHFFWIIYLWNFVEGDYQIYYQLKIWTIFLSCFIDETVKKLIKKVIIWMNKLHLTEINLEKLGTKSKIFPLPFNICSGETMGQVWYYLGTKSGTT